MFRISPGSASMTRLGRGFLSLVGGVMGEYLSGSFGAANLKRRLDAIGHEGT